MKFFDSFTIYIGLGIIAGLGVFIFIFRKWNFPQYLKKRYGLNTRTKIILFIMLQGILLALLLAMLMNVLRIQDIAAQVLEGAAIGFNCAVLAGLFREGEAKNSAKAQSTSVKRRPQASDNRGRRSKG